MGLCKKERCSLLWICLLATFITVLAQGGNVRRVYRLNGNYGRRIVPQISSVLETPSQHFRVHEPLLVVQETRRIGSVIPRPSNRLGLPAVQRQDQLAEETESSEYAYATPDGTTAKPGYTYKRPPPVAEITEPDHTEDIYDNETPQETLPEREAEFADQEAAFGLESIQEVDAEGIEPERLPSPVSNSPVAELPDSDSQCNENDHDCWPHGYKGVIRGEAGTDYPILTEIIPTAFDCNNVQYSGYYADTDETARCQIFHICLRRNGHRRTQKWSFLCPNGTVFDQGNFVCVWWDMAPECNKNTVEPLYDLNAALGWDNITESKFDVHSVMSAMGDSQKSRNFEETSFQPSSTRLKSTVVENPTRRPVVRMRVVHKTKTSTAQQSRNGAYRIPVRVSDGARDRTALKPVTNNIGDYPEHDTDESSTYETSLRTEHNSEARYKTKSASSLHKSQSEAYEEKSDPQSIRPLIVNNRRPYIDREESTTSAYENEVPTVVMMPTQQRYPDGTEGVVNVPVIIMKPKSSNLRESYNNPNYSEVDNPEAPDQGYLPPSKTTEEYDPVEQPLTSTSSSQYLPPATEVIPPATEEAQYDEEIDQQSPQSVFTDDTNLEIDEKPTSDIDEGYKYPKAPRQILSDPVEVSTTEASGYGYRQPKTQPKYIQQQEETTTETGYIYRRPTTTAEPIYSPEEAYTTESEGYVYRKPANREPEYIKQEPELSTQIIQEEYTTERLQSKEYLPPRQETTETPAGAYLPPSTEATESPAGTYLPPREETTESSTGGYLPPRREQTTKSPEGGYLPPSGEQTTKSPEGGYLPPSGEQTTKSPEGGLPPRQEQATKSPAGAYLPPKQEQATEEVVEATEATVPTTQQLRTTTTVPAAYLPPKDKEEEGYSYPSPVATTQNERRATTEASSNAYLPPKKVEEKLADSTTQEARTSTEASSRNAYLPPKSNSNVAEESNVSPVTGRAITQKIAPAPVENSSNIVLPGVDTKESSEESDITEEQSSEEANEVTNPAKEDITEKYHFPTPSTPIVTPDSEDLGPPSQLYNANVRQQLFAKNKNKPYAENPESQEKINEIIRQLQAGVAEAEDSNGKKIDFAEFAKLNAKIALVVPERGTNGTSQTAQTLIFDTSTESVTEALKDVQSSVSPSLASPSPSSVTLPLVETFIQNPFENQDFTSINTPQYEINLPTKEFESHSVENSIDYDRKQNQGNQQQFSGQYQVVSQNYPQVQVQQPQVKVQQPQISNYIQPQVSLPNQAIQTPILSTVIYNPPIAQPQNFILPITSPEQFNPQQLFFQTQSQPQQLQEPVYSPPLPPPSPQPQQQQKFIQTPSQLNFVQHSSTPQQNFVQQSPPPQQNYIPQAPAQQNFVQQNPVSQQNFVQQAPAPQQNFIQQIPQRNNFVQQTPLQQNFVQQQPQQNNYRDSQQDNIFSPPPRPQAEIFRAPAQQQPEIFRAPAQQQPEIFRAPAQQQPEFRAPLHQQQNNNQPQQVNFNQQQGHQRQQSQTDSRYLPPGPSNFQQNNIFRQQQQQFQQPQPQATYNQPQIVDFVPAKSPTLETNKTPKKLINPADIKIVPAIFVHHHTSVENPDGSPIEEEKRKQNQQSESRPRQQQQQQQQSFQSAGYYESSQQNINQFRNTNYLSFTAQQTENVPVAVTAPKTKPSLPPPPSPSNVFSQKEVVPAPQLEKFTLDDARTAEQLQQYHRENLKSFVPTIPSRPEITTSYRSGSAGRLDMSPEQSSLADTSRFYPGRDNSLGVKLTYV